MRKHLKTADVSVELGAVRIITEQGLDLRDVSQRFEVDETAIPRWLT